MPEGSPPPCALPSAPLELPVKLAGPFGTAFFYALGAFVVDGQEAIAAFDVGDSGVHGARLPDSGA